MEIHVKRNTYIYQFLVENSVKLEMSPSVHIINIKYYVIRPNFDNLLIYFGTYVLLKKTWLMADTKHQQIDLF